jgi:nitrogen-specific signal transduction histidine kinase
LAHLFSPVQSTKAGKNRGMGLSIVQGLVKKINGLISCRSSKEGTVFELLVPARKVARPMAAAVSTRDMV